MGVKVKVTNIFVGETFVKYFMAVKVMATKVKVVHS